nr:HAMP domain-containing sensor histidine kinase [Nocardioides panzhihuensis]
MRTVTGTPEQAWLLPDGTEVLVVSTIRRPSLNVPVDQVAISLRSGRGRKRLDRERSDLVATVAHELRSPLTGVKGFVQALLNRWDKLNDDQKKLMLKTVASDSDRLSRLIAELLDVARIDTGRLQLYPRASDATVLVTRVVESVRSATSRPIELHVEGGIDGGIEGGIDGGIDGAAEDELEIHADPDKFTQVVTNLVENAVRHGDGVVTVSLSASPDDPAQVLLVVEDHGEGIPAELRQRVFTKFWKHGARGGSGLGLYIVGGLTHAHGGTVRIADADSGGARIEVTWPREQPAT